MSDDFRIGEWLVQPRLNALVRNGETVHIQAKVMDVLVCLARQAGLVVAKDELINEVWAGAFVTDEVVTNAIWELRQALGDRAKESRIIQTIPRRGYRLVAPVVPASAAISRTPRRRGWLRLAVLALALAAAALAVFQHARRSRGDPVVRALVVLPLENLSGDPSQDFLADGVTEALITELAQIRDLRVISRTSAMSYKGTRTPLFQIVRDLDVDVAVEGAVVRSGNTVRLTAQLIDARGDRHLWAASYERPIDDILSVQAELTTAVAHEIRRELAPQQARRFQSPSPVDPIAFEEYLRGLHVSLRTLDDIEKARGHFEHAVSRDPRFALAHARLAELYVQAAWRALLPAREAMPKAREGAARALLLEPFLGVVYAVRAAVSELYDYDWRAAEDDYLKALELNPSDAETRQDFAQFLAGRGRSEEALQHAQLARVSDPRQPSTHTTLAWIYYLMRRDPEALKHYRFALEVAADPFGPLRLMALVLDETGRHQEAIAELEKAWKMHPDDMHVLALMAQAYARDGNRPQALANLDRLLGLSRSRPLLATAVAKVYAHRGDRDAAFDWLEKAIEERSGSLVLLRVNPQFDPLRSDPRFDEILARLRL